MPRERVLRPAVRAMRPKTISPLNKIYRMPGIMTRTQALNHMAAMVFYRLYPHLYIFADERFSTRRQVYEEMKNLLVTLMENDPPPPGIDNPRTRREHDLRNLLRSVRKSYTAIDLAAEKPVDNWEEIMPEHYRRSTEAPSMMLEALCEGARTAVNQKMLSREWVLSVAWKFVGKAVAAFGTERDKFLPHIAWRITGALDGSWSFERVLSSTWRERLHVDDACEEHEAFMDSDIDCHRENEEDNGLVFSTVMDDAFLHDDTLVLDEFKACGFTINRIHHTGEVFEIFYPAKGKQVRMAEQEQINQDSAPSLKEDRADTILSASADNSRPIQTQEVSRGNHLAASNVANDELSALSRKLFFQDVHSPREARPAQPSRKSWQPSRKSWAQPPTDPYSTKSEDAAPINSTSATPCSDRNGRKKVWTDSDTAQTGPPLGTTPSESIHWTDEIKSLTMDELYGTLDSDTAQTGQPPRTTPSESIHWTDEIRSLTEDELYGTSNSDNNPHLFTKRHRMWSGDDTLISRTPSEPARAKAQRLDCANEENAVVDQNAETPNRTSRLFPDAEAGATAPQGVNTTLDDQTRPQNEHAKAKTTAPEELDTTSGTGAKTPSPSRTEHLSESVSDSSLRITRYSTRSDRAREWNQEGTFARHIYKLEEGEFTRLVPSTTAQDTGAGATAPEEVNTTVDDRTKTQSQVEWHDEQGREERRRGSVLVHSLPAMASRSTDYPSSKAHAGEAFDAPVATSGLGLGATSQKPWPNPAMAAVVGVAAAAAAGEKTPANLSSTMALVPKEEQKGEEEKSTPANSGSTTALVPKEEEKEEENSTPANSGSTTALVPKEEEKEEEKSTLANSGSTTASVPKEEEKEEEKSTLANSGSTTASVPKEEEKEEEKSTPADSGSTTASVPKEEAQEGEKEEAPQNDDNAGTYTQSPLQGLRLLIRSADSQKHNNSLQRLGTETQVNDFNARIKALRQSSATESTLPPQTAAADEAQKEKGEEKEEEKEEKKEEEKEEEADQAAKSPPTTHTPPPVAPKDQHKVVGKWDIISRLDRLWRVV
ncbi:hypothetical protein IWZ01DRAFT_503094 [Phyllosticta capitalensis]